MKVLVVSYAPTDGRAATGGFDWFPWSGFEGGETLLFTSHGSYLGQIVKRLEPS